MRESPGKRHFYRVIGGNRQRISTDGRAQPTSSYMDAAAIGA